MAKVKISIGLVMIIVAVVFGIYFTYYSDLSTVSIIPSVIKEVETEKNIELFFYDLKENCVIDGLVFVDNYFLGKTSGGIFLLNESEYMNNFFDDVEVSIFGKTDYCFGNDAGLSFKEVWDVSNLDYYLENNEVVFFEADVNPRWPVYPEEMQGFVRPDEVKERLLEMGINMNDSQLENIEKIFGHTYMNWASDNSKFKQAEYWQTPSDFIRNKGGDCEDWAVYFLSLLREYNSSLDCYAAVWYTHMNVLCQVDNLFIIFDQNKVRKNLVLDEEWTLQDNQIAVRSWRNNYFKEYGIPPDERILYYLFNEKEYIRFENGQEDFIDWVLEVSGVINV